MATDTVEVNGTIVRHNRTSNTIYIMMQYDEDDGKGGIEKGEMSRLNISRSEAEDLYIALTQIL